jgi:hypothetical protein
LGEADGCCETRSLSPSSRLPAWSGGCNRIEE